MKRLSSGSPRIMAAMAFGRHMDIAMKRHGVGKRPLSEAAGVGISAIGEYRRGRNLPTTATAARIATALHSPKLRTIVEDARRGSCDTCGAVVWQDYGRPTIYCSPPCRTVGAAAGHASRRRGTRVDREALQGALGTLRGAVDAFCGDCPDNDEGHCGNGACALYVVTSLRHRTSDKEARLVTKPAGPFSEQASANRSEGMRKAWANDPERRRKSAERARERWASMSEEERDEAGRAISVGRRAAASTSATRTTVDGPSSASTNTSGKAA